MATQTRRRILAILFAAVLAVPAAPVIASPPDHAKAHGHDKAEAAAQPAKSEKSVQADDKTNQAGGTSELCSDFIDAPHDEASPAESDGVYLSWDGPTLSYQIEAGYSLDLCLKSATKVDLFNGLKGDGTVTTSDGKNISHIGYILTEIATPEEPSIEPEAPADEEPTAEQPPADEVPADDQPPADETPAGEEPPADDPPANEQPPAEETPADEGTPTTLPGDNRDTSDDPPASQDQPAQDTPQETTQNDPAAAQPNEQQFAEPDTQVAGLVITAPPTGPTAAAVVTPPVDTPAAVTPATEVAASTVASSTVIAAPATLPFTGFESTIWAALGAAILAAGAALLLAGREPHIGRHEAR